MTHLWTAANPATTWKRGNPAYMTHLGKKTHKTVITIMTNLTALPAKTACAPFKTSLQVFHGMPTNPKHITPKIASCSSIKTPNKTQETVKVDPITICSNS
uniref:Uncharacterized protein n=1 Tax=Romanomermis culicivorax TaxID=13658 RepID=A0A915KG34_ROMCU